MPILLQQRIFRIDLQNNREVLYVFGDNERRTGFGGQAKEMRGEPNAVGIRTKTGPGMLDKDFWHDCGLLHNQHMIDQDFGRLYEHLESGGLVVWPTDGIGTGLSQLRSRAPETFRYLGLKQINLFKTAGKEV